MSEQPSLETIFNLLRNQRNENKSRFLQTFEEFYQSKSLFSSISQNNLLNQQQNQNDNENDKNTELNQENLSAVLEFTDISNEVHIHCPKCKETLASPNVGTFSLKYHPKMQYGQSINNSNNSNNNNNGNNNGKDGNFDNSSNLESFGQIEFKDHLFPFEKWWKMRTVMSFDNIALSKETPESSILSMGKVEFINNLESSPQSQQEQIEKNIKNNPFNTTFQFLSRPFNIVSLTSEESINRLLTCAVCESDILGFVNKTGECYVPCQKVLYRAQIQ